MCNPNPDVNTLVFDEILLRLVKVREREHGSKETAIEVLMTLQPMYENLGLLGESRTVLLDHVKGLIYVFLDVRVWITRSDDTLRSFRQHDFALFPNFISNAYPI